ncbi:MAG: hypothetical protein JWP74_3095 [Marmoricola sp.]|nr:hypothetical protein [Marmoricola sp.]
MRKFGAALAISVLLVTAGCGGSSGGGGSSRPSASDISKALRQGGDRSVLGASASKLSKKSADCVGKALTDSKVSDKALKALVKGDKTFKPSTSDTKAITTIESAVIKCVSADVPTS